MIIQRTISTETKRHWFEISKLSRWKASYWDMIWIFVIVTATTRIVSIIFVITAIIFSSEKCPINFFIRARTFLIHLKSNYIIDWSLVPRVDLLLYDFPIEVHIRMLYYNTTDNETSKVNGEGTYALEISDFLKFPIGYHI